MFQLRYGPIRLAKVADAMIVGNFTTGGILVDPASGKVARETYLGRLKRGAESRRAVDP